MPVFLFAKIAKIPRNGLFLFKDVFDSVKGFGAYDVFYLTRVGFGGFRADADSDKILRQDFVAFIYSVGGTVAKLGQLYKALRVDSDILLFFEKIDGARYARLRIARFGYDVYGTDCALLFS